MQLIFGANGPSGRAFIRTLTHPADTVAVLRRPSEDSFFSEHRIQTTVADALDADALDKVFAQYRPDSVISFVGGKNEQGIRSDALGNINIIAAAQAANPQARFILITSMGCGEQWDMMSEPFKQALGEAVRAKTEAEIYLKQSSLNWTILRPCGLADGDDDSYNLTLQPEGIPKKYMTRNGLATAVSAILRNPDSIDKVYTVGAGS